MANDTEHTHHHILPLSTYLGVGALLLVLTGVTVWVALALHFGPFNLFVAMIIAGAKASLVVLYFMHLKYDNKLYAFVFVSALLFLALFIALTMVDTTTRGDVNPESRGPINQQAQMYMQSDTTAADTTAADTTQADTTATDTTAAATDGTAAGDTTRTSPGGVSMDTAGASGGN